MAHFAGLDVSIEETAVCVVDDQGAVVMQCSAPTKPEAILAASPCQRKRQTPAPAKRATNALKVGMIGMERASSEAFKRREMIFNIGWWVGALPLRPIGSATIRKRRSFNGLFCWPRHFDG